MPNDFDAGKEADKIHDLAKEAIDACPGHQALHKLHEEYLSLNQAQRNAVGRELEDRDGWLTRMPSPSVESDKGNVTSITFERSFWDVHKSGFEKVTIAADHFSGKHYSAACLKPGR